MTTSEGLTPSEVFVSRLCTESFLSLWCHPNPRAEPGKELCDLLVVCDPDVVIISVKEVALQKDDDDQATEDGAKRWIRKAVTRSIEQVRGAERFLTSATRVVRCDGSPGVELPPIERRRTHRIAVAFGSERKIEIPNFNDGRGFVHVFDEKSFSIVLEQLDTISDFVHYLTAKERFLDSASAALEGEEDLLALYILGRRSLPLSPDFFHIKPGWWTRLEKEPAFLRKKAAEEISYFWDHLIEHFVREALDGRLELSATMDEMERAVRILAREPRVERRLLAQRFDAFMQSVMPDRPQGCAVQSPSDKTIGYVFMWAGNLNGEERCAELVVRCVCARGMLPGCISVVGICAFPEGPGVVAEIALLHKPEWDEEDEATLREWRDERGMFGNPRQLPPDPEYPPDAGR